MNIRLTFRDEIPVAEVAVEEARLRHLCPTHRKNDPRVLLLMPSAEKCRAVREAIAALERRGLLQSVEGECKPDRTASSIRVRLNEGDTPLELVLRPTVKENPLLAGLLEALAATGMLTFSEHPVCAICLKDEVGVRRMVRTRGGAICDECVAAGRARRNANLMPHASPDFLLVVECDFCRNQVGYMMRGEEANVCEACLRLCEEALKRPSDPSRA